MSKTEPFTIAVVGGSFLFALKYGIAQSNKSNDKYTCLNQVRIRNIHVNPPRLIRFREYRRGFQTPHELSFMPATLGRSGFPTTDTAQTQWLCRAALPSAGASGFALDVQSTA